MHVRSLLFYKASESKTMQDRNKARRKAARCVTHHFTSHVSSCQVRICLQIAMCVFRISTSHHFLNCHGHEGIRIIRQGRHGRHREYDTQRITKASQGCALLQKASDSFSTNTLSQPQDLSHRCAVGSHKHIGTVKMLRAASNTSKTVLKEMWRTKMLLKRRQEIEQGRKAVLATVACHNKIPWQDVPATKSHVSATRKHIIMSAKYPKYISNIFIVFQCMDADRLQSLWQKEHRKEGKTWQN